MPGGIGRCAGAAADSERVRGWAEGIALGGGVDLGVPYREHEAPKVAHVEVAEAAVAHRELPASVPLGGPHVGEALERSFVGDLDGVPLDHDVQPLVPAIAAGGQNDVRVGAQV